MGFSYGESGSTAVSDVVTQPLSGAHAGGVPTRRQRVRLFFSQETPRRATFAILLLLAMWIGSRGIHSASTTRPSVDSGVFTAMGWHILNGYVPYRDAWDHKPPMTHFLNAAAIGLGEKSINAVRQMERLFGAAAAGLAFLIAWMVFRRVWLAMLAVLFFAMMFYHPVIFDVGNSTEEYGTVFLLAGIAAAIASRRGSRRRMVLLALLCGVAMGCAMMCKEPFLLPALPWMILAAWPRKPEKDLATPSAVPIPAQPVDVWSRRKKRRRPPLYVPLVMLGAFIPMGAFMVYFLANGALNDWINMIAFQFLYAGGDQTRLSLPMRFGVNFLFVFARFALMSWLVLAFVVCGMVSVFFGEFRRRTNGVGVVVLATVVLGVFAASLSGRYYGYYSLLLVPAMVLLAVFGVEFVVGLVAKISPRRRVAVATSLLLLAGTLVVVSECVRLFGPGSIQFTGREFGLNSSKRAVAFINGQIDTYANRQLVGFARRMARPMSRWDGDELTRYVRRYAGQSVWLSSSDFSYVYLEAGVFSPIPHLYVGPQLFVDMPGSKAAQQCQQVNDDLAAKLPVAIVDIASWEFILRQYGMQHGLTPNYRQVDRVVVDSVSNRKRVVIWQKKQDAPAP